MCIDCVYNENGICKCEDSEYWQEEVSDDDECEYEEVEDKVA
jgi:hypothetical protein